MTAGRSYYESRGPGYSYYVPSATFAGRHDFFPGKYTGYAAVVIPGVNEAIDAGDAMRAEEQLAALAAAINRCAELLEKANH